MTATLTETFTAVGRSTRRLEGREKVTGAAEYVADVTLPGTVYARPVLSPYPHARIRSISTMAAERVPGVVAVLTAHDLGAGDLLARDEVFYTGEPVAVVVAASPAQALDAAELLEVDYEPLPVVLDPVAAMRPDAPLTRPEGAQHEGESAEAHGAAASEAAESEEKPRNVNSMVHFRRGDVERALNGADVVIEDTYRIAAVHQGYIEPQSALAQALPDGAVTVWASTQGQFFVRQHVANALALPDHRLRVVPMTVGGGFGGKIVLLEPLAGRLARYVRRPVQLVLDRSQDFVVGHPAQGATITLRLGARNDGTPVALAAQLVFDAGARPGAPVGIAALLLGGTYRIPNLDIVGYEVLTHKTPVGAYRGPGAPHAYFALESHIDRLARRLGIDPIELRLRHAAQEGDERPDEKPWPRIGLHECLERVREHPLWRARNGSHGEGYGVAVGGWPGGIEPATAACRVNGDGSLTVQVGSVDITGSHTTMALIAAEVFGMDPAKVQVAAGDTDVAPYAGLSAGSKTVYTVGAAVQQAAQEAKRQLLEMAATKLEIAVDDLEMVDGRIQPRGVPSSGIDVAALASESMQFGSPYPPIHGQGRTAVNNQSPGFAVHVAHVHVDETTGQVRPLEYLAVQDVGRAINPAEVTGQIQGGVMQGIGRALLERMVYDDNGQLVDASFADYGLPGIGEAPEIRVEMVEVPSAYGPFGAKGVGEPPVIPVAAAIANAVDDAVGVRATEIPIAPEAVLAGLSRVAG